MTSGRPRCKEFSVRYGLVHYVCPRCGGLGFCPFRLVPALPSIRCGGCLGHFSIQSIRESVKKTIVALYLKEGDQDE